MCLTKVTKITNRKRRGWKVFGTTEFTKLRPLYYYRSSGTPTIPEDVWIRDPHAGEKTRYGRPNYLVGFHIFLDRDGAERVCEMPPKGRTIRRVRFRKVVAQGLQLGGGPMVPTVVAEEIYVESEKEKESV